MTTSMRKPGKETPEMIRHGEQDFEGRKDIYSKVDLSDAVYTVSFPSHSPLSELVESTGIFCTS